MDLEASAVEVWTPTDLRPTVVRDTLTWQAAGTEHALRLDIASLLRTD